MTIGKRALQAEMIGRKLVTAATEKDVGDIIFKDVRAFMGASAAIYISGIAIDTVRAPRIRSVGLDDDMLRQHLALIEEDPSRPDQIAAWVAGEDRVLTPAIVQRRLRTRTAYRRGVLGSRSLSPLGAIICGDRGETILGVFRSLSVPYDRPEIARFRLFMPYFAAAVRKVEALEQASELRWMLNRLTEQAHFDAIVAFGDDLRIIDVVPNESRLVRSLLGRRWPEGEPSRTQVRLMRGLRASLRSGDPATLRLPQMVDLDTGSMLVASIWYVDAPPGRRVLLGLRSPDRRRMTVDPAVHICLSAKEVAVTKLAAQGKSNREIAEAHNVSLATVAKQLGTAYRKLGVSNRAELTAALASARIVMPRWATARQRQVIDGISQGLSNAMIAELLAIRPSTVESHVTRIMTLIGAKARTELLWRLSQTEAAERHELGDGSGRKSRESW